MDRLNLRNLKAQIHRTLLSKLDLEKLGRVGNDRAREATVRLIQENF
jgi:pilus assembly protein CpaF